MLTPKDIKTRKAKDALEVIEPAGKRKSKTLFVKV